MPNFWPVALASRCDRRGKCAWHWSCFPLRQPRINTAWTKGYYRGPQRAAAPAGRAPRRKAGVFLMSATPSDDEIVLLARQAGLNLPPEYFSDLIEAYGHFR